MRFENFEMKISNLGFAVYVILKPPGSAQGGKKDIIKGKTDHLKQA